MHLKLVVAKERRGNHILLHLFPSCRLPVFSEHLLHVYLHTYHGHRYTPSYSKQYVTPQGAYTLYQALKPWMGQEQLLH